MTFDINILCCYQDKPVDSLPFPSVFQFNIRNKNKYSHGKCYYSWQFMNSCPGFWYDFLPKDFKFGEEWGCSRVGDILYDEEKMKIRLPKFYAGEDDYADIFEYIEFLPEFGIKQKYRKGLKKVIRYFIDQSPVNMIIFLLRFQGDDKDIIQGVFPKEEFFKMLDNKQVKFNHCYVIGNESGIPKGGLSLDDLKTYCQWRKNIGRRKKSPT